jgi:hypothetical protein
VWVGVLDRSPASVNARKFLDKLHIHELQNKDFAPWVHFTYMDTHRWKMHIWSLTTKQYIESLINTLNKRVFINFSLLTNEALGPVLNGPFIDTQGVRLCCGYRMQLFPTNTIPCDQAIHRPYKTTYSPFVLKVYLQTNKAKYQLCLFLPRSQYYLL